MTTPVDTSPAARDVQVAAFRAMGAGLRLQAAFQMSEETRRIAVAGFRSRHPDWPPARVEAAVAELLIGARVATPVP